MSHELNSAGAVFTRCDGTPLTGDDKVIVSNIEPATLSDPARIVLMDTVGPEASGCPRILVGVDCASVSAASQLVLGVDDSPDHLVVWRRTAVPILGVTTFSSGGNIDPNLGFQVYVYRDVGVGTVNVQLPFTDCDPNELWIKNRGGGTLTVSSDAGNIDGVASVAVGINEAIHLVFDVDATEWLRI